MPFFSIFVIYTSAIQFSPIEIVPPLIRPLPPKAIPLIRPDFRCTGKVKYN
jgi:hypothetical protein